MCFSAEADLVAGAVIGAVGVDAVRHGRHRPELALASLPLLFAAHQLTEAVVWEGLDGDVSASATRAAIALYLTFAFVVLPVLVPLAVRAVEPDGLRRRFMAVCAGAGALAAAAYLGAILQGPITARVDGQHIAYTLPEVGPGELVDAVYVVVCCLPLLASSHRRLVTFGVLNVAAVIGLFWLTETGRISLWCVWAALTSVLIAVHLRRVAAPSQRPLQSRGPAPELEHGGGDAAQAGDHSACGPSERRGGDTAHHAGHRRRQRQR